jgi:hypothetical protein
MPCHMSPLCLDCNHSSTTHSRLRLALTFGSESWLIICNSPSSLPGMSFKCGDIEVITHPTSVIDDDSHYIENLQSTFLPKASVQVEGHMPLLCDILFEYDLPIELRDGVKVYADVYRPPLAKDHSVPAIIVAGPFGKNGGPNRYHFDKFTWRMGCPRGATSGLEKFEGPDPAYWCLNGYAIVHTGMSIRHSRLLVLTCTT